MRHPYATEAYAKILRHMGLDFEIPEWGTYVIVRDIPGGGVDVVGCYPLSVISRDADLQGGLIA